MDKYSRVAEMLSAKGIKIFENEPLAPHSTFRIGGAARLAAMPDSTERIIDAVKAAKEEELDTDVLNHYLSEYDYLQKEQPEIIQEALKEKHLGLIKKRKALTRILDKLRSIIRTFSWE